MTLLSARFSGFRTLSYIIHIAIIMIVDTNEYVTSRMLSILVNITWILDGSLIGSANGVEKKRLGEDEVMIWPR